MTASAQGWVCYDAHCTFCTRWARRVARSLAAKGFAVLPLQTPWVEKSMAARGEPLLKQMRIITPAGRIYGGADALIYLAGFFWWALPVRALRFLPGFRKASAALYEYVAKRRYCFGGSCHLQPTGQAKAMGHKGRRTHRLRSFYDLEEC